MTTTEPGLILHSPKAGDHRRTTCKYCQKTANRAGGLCSRHHRLWLQGTPGITPNVKSPSKPMVRCSECTEPAKAKGLCRSHYRRHHRSLKPPVCTLPYCSDPRRKDSRLFCQPHSLCIVDHCTTRFKARRLCTEHYRTIFLQPRDKRAKDRIRSEGSAQPALLEEPEHIPTNEYNADLLGDQDLTFLMGHSAPPLHRQANCAPAEAQDLQECADALNMLLKKGILPPTAVLEAKARTARMLATRLTSKNSSKEATA